MTLNALFCKKKLWKYLWLLLSDLELERNGGGLGGRGEFGVCSGFEVGQFIIFKINFER